MNPLTTFTDALTPVLANTFLHVVLLGILAVIVERLTRRQPASLRGVILILSIGLWLILPLWNTIAPGLGAHWRPVNWPGSRSAELVDARVTEPVATPGAFVAFAPSDPVIQGDSRASVPPATIMPAEASATVPWSALLCAVWMIGSVWMLGRWTRSMMLLARLKRTLRPLDEEQERRLHKGMESAAGGSRLPRVRVSPDDVPPCSFGVLRPVIVLPERALTDWTESEVAAAVAHELAHCRHRDHLLGLLQRLAGVLYWWNPATHLINRRLDLNQELRSDAAALNAVGDRKTYARLLLKVASEISVPFPPARLGVCSMAGTLSSLEQRIKTLNQKGNIMQTQPLKRGQLTALFAAATVLTAPILGIQIGHAQDGEREREVERDIEIRETPPADARPTAPRDAGPAVAELVIQENGNVFNLRLPLNDKTRNSTIAELLAEMKETAREERSPERHALVDREVEVRRNFPSPRANIFSTSGETAPLLPPPAPAPPVWEGDVLEQGGRRDRSVDLAAVARHRADAVRRQREVIHEMQNADRARQQALREQVNAERDSMRELMEEMRQEMAEMRAAQEELRQRLESEISN